MYTDRFLKDKRGVRLEPAERAALEAAISDIKTFPPRKTVVFAGETMNFSMLLIDGLMSRYIDDRRGFRQLVAVHVPGDFMDLHGFPLKQLDHDVATLTASTVAMVPHRALEQLIEAEPPLARKLWFATLIDAAIHRAWLFRLGRLDATGRVAHFICEMNARLVAADCSDGQSFALGLTQVDLAEICGLTTVHVNRVVRILREEGLCRIQAGRVEILDLKRLTARAQFDPYYLYNAHP
ncbi:Crp/Fnr family transcriptional regulator [Sandaracinobacteroides hominis]|uniref:Crp/Fnr family transcriptional regulator n=1 Tax=Sandaracinobacteroides hominis TaxID=2780086 RepID=UPI0018F3E18A|nr:Crp/Fnr family transcriptional regulator [Sandaracinobacteroides hominis]